MMNKFSSDAKFWLFGLRIMGEFAGLIAIPVILLVLLGQWLDRRWGMSPWFTIGAFILAAIISATLVWKRTKEVAKEYQALIDEKTKSKDKNI